jgi:phosphoglycerate-specific signal transduction histidine kinase
MLGYCQVCGRYLPTDTTSLLLAHVEDDDRVFGGALELHDQMNSALIPVSQLLIRLLALGCTVCMLRLRLTKTLRDYSVFKRLPII